MATNPFEKTKSKNPFVDDETSDPVSQGGLKGSVGAAARGFAEAVPFTGEKIAESFDLPKPKTFPERLTRRAARNLPYALASAPFTGGIPSALGFV